MKECVKKCINSNSPCNEKKCRMWMDYKNDLNCANISIDKNGSMKLMDIADRLGLSYVRIHQIERDALAKVKKKEFKE